MLVSVHRLGGEFLDDDNSDTTKIEPTESESPKEIDRFADAMLAIRAEADEIAAGKQPRENNVFKNAPHTLERVVTEKWDR
jgi:glycine dehydrogenase